METPKQQHKFFVKPEDDKHISKASQKELLEKARDMLNAEILNNGFDITGFSPVMTGTSLTIKQNQDVRCEMCGKLLFKCDKP